MKIFIICTAVFLVHAAVTNAQDIEAKLSGSTTTQGFTVKDNSATSLFTVRGDGRVGVGAALPSAQLHVAGTGGLLVTGTFGNGAIPQTGSGIRLMFYSKKAAFRCGSVNGTQWDDSNIGAYSTAMGTGTTAGGSDAFAMGLETNAIGEYSTALGLYTSAESFATTAIGRYNVGGGNGINWSSADPVFEVGIGTGPAARANALTVYKNGDIKWAGSTLVTDQGGSIELGSSTVSGSWPYIDFHCGNVSPQDFNYRIVNDGDKSLTFLNQGNAVVSMKSAAVGILTASPAYTLHVNGSAGKPGGGSWTTASDIRLKNVDGDYVRGLDAILKLHSIRFHYKQGNARIMPTGNEEIGFIAQEVANIFPECVTEGTDGYLDFNMHAINVALVNAVKELNGKLEAERTVMQALRAEKDAEIAALRGEVAELRTLKTEVAALKASLLDMQKLNGGLHVVNRLDK
jgi:trimeric autotransporter adhesin